MSERSGTAGCGFWGDDSEESSLRYRSLLDSIDDGIYQLDHEGRFVGVNGAFLEATGYARDDLLGEPVSEIFTESDADDVVSTVRTLSETAVADGTTLDLSIRTADGFRLSCQHRFTPVAEGDGGVVGVARALERGGAEPAERPPDSTLATVLDEAEVGVFVLDSTFDVVWIDETAERYFGLDREEAIGRNKRDVIAEDVREAVADPERFAETVLATYEDNTYLEQFTCRVTSGEDRDARWLEHLSKPIDSGRYVGGRVELYYDVTVQHQRASHLRSLHEGVSEWLTESSREVVAERACRYLTDVLGLELNGVFLYDEPRGELRPSVISEPALETIDEPPTFDEGEGLAWRAFENGDPEVYDDVTVHPEVYNPDTPIRSEIVLPIGDHGVVLVGSRERNAFDDNDLTLAKLVASSLEATFDRLRHEHDLERERDLTDSILDTTPIGIQVLDAEGEIVRTNDRAAELLAVPRDDTGTYDPSDLTVYDDEGVPIPAEERPFARALETGEPVYDEVFRVELPDGDHHWLSISAAPVLTDGGEIDQVVTTAEDVTHLKERERRLERRTDELATELDEIFGRVTDAFYALDDQWRFTHVNDRAEELIDFTGEGLVGKHVWETFEWAADSKIREEYERAMETQEPTSFEIYYPEPLGAWFEITAYPSESGLSVYFRDVTERKERERALEESERQYRTLVEHFPNGAVALVDEDLRYVTFGGTPEGDTDVTSEDLEGSDLRGALPQEVADVVVPRYEATLEGERFEFESTIGDRVYQFRFVPVRDEDGEIFAALGMSQDVTERKEYERKLEESNERLEQFAYAASHDLQEPLRMVSSYLQLIERRYAEDLDDDGREFVEYAVDGADRMRAMIDGLLEYSRVESRGDPLEPVDLERIVRDVRSDLRLQIEESGAEITVEDLPRVEGDERQLRQVFQNLLENAIEYSGEASPRIRIEAEREGGEWVVSVSDEGIGIDPDDQERIFEVFDRLHTREEHDGTGIGLALCKRIVERHDGDIRVDSEPGEGATFSVRLPAVDE